MKGVQMITQILSQLIQPNILILCLLGTAFGVIVGAIPGLSGVIGISLLLPFSYKLSPVEGLILLGGIYQGGMYGGAITAILLNVPGDVVATCTAIEGFPMAQQGRSKEALYYSIFASVFGGIIGVLALILFSPPLATFALRFGPPEIFLLGLCGLSIVGALVGKNHWKSLFSVSIGLLIATIGRDPMSTLYRLTYNVNWLRQGISIVPLVLGLYCFSEMFLNLGQQIGEKSFYKDESVKRLEVIKNILKKPFNLIRSSIIGVLIGILPGIGGATAVFMSYGVAKSNSKEPELYGKGSTEGLVAAEAANNALVGGALIPTLALGLPGSPAAAIISSVLVMHGVVIGSDLFTSRPEIAYTFIYGLLLTVVAMLAIGVWGVKYFSHILKIKMKYIVPVVVIFAFFGAYSGSYNLTDIYTAVLLGFLGVLFRKLDFPISPIVIGAVLSSMIELNFRRTVQMQSATDLNIFMFIIKRPASMVIIAIVFIFFAFLIFRNYFRKRRKVA